MKNVECNSQGQVQIPLLSGITAEMPLLGNQWLRRRTFNEKAHRLSHCLLQSSMGQMAVKLSHAIDYQNYKTIHLKNQ